MFKICEVSLYRKRSAFTVSMLLQSQAQVYTEDIAEQTILCHRLWPFLKG